MHSNIWKCFCFPGIGYRSDILTIRCVKGCGVYLSCPCDPKDGPIGKLFVSFKTVV